LDLTWLSYFSRPFLSLLFRCRVTFYHFEELTIFSIAGQVANLRMLLNIIVDLSCIDFKTLQDALRQTFPPIQSISVLVLFLAEIFDKCVALVYPLLIRKWFQFRSDFQ